MENEPINEPHFKLSVNRGEESQEFIATRDNSSLFRHMGELAIYDHAYFDLADKQCTRIWRHDASYPQVENYMLSQGFPLHANLREVNKYDIEAYDEMISRQAGLESVPEDWQ